MTISWCRACRVLVAPKGVSPQLLLQGRTKEAAGGNIVLLQPMDHPCAGHHLVGANHRDDPAVQVASDGLHRCPNERRTFPSAAVHTQDVRVLQHRQLAARHAGNRLRHNLHRVTGTCMPEMEVMRRREQVMMEVWTQADQKRER